MSAVTIPLLDSMLTPTPGQPAETLYRSIPLSNRVRELTTLLTQLYNSNNAGGTVNDSNNEGRSLLAAVLLRREISALGGNESMTGIPTSNCLALMGETAEPLMSLFTLDNSSVNQSRRQIGHCIAELCCSLSVVSPNDGREWMKSVLGRLEPGVSYCIHMHHLMCCTIHMHQLYSCAHVPLYFVKLLSIYFCDSVWPWIQCS